MIASRPTRSLRALAWIVGVLLALLSAAFPVGADPGPPVLLIVGDSVSAGYGLPPGSGWVDLLAKKLAVEHYPHRVVNASITGDTTAGGLARLPSLLAKHKPAIAVIELGGNDGLRGGDLKAASSNLDKMVTLSQQAGARVLLIGMQIPPNYGAAYVRQFSGIYPSVAESRKVSLVPFLFDGFGERNELFQPDRIHPTAAAQPKLLDNVWPALSPLLKPKR